MKSIGFFLLGIGVNVLGVCFRLAHQGHFHTREPALPFEDWKGRLRDDCDRQHELLAYTTLGDECLQILWEAGTEPTVQGVIESSIGNRRVS